MENNDLLKKLRESTAALHKQIEKQNPAQALLNHSIDLESYKLLLLQNYQAYRHIEDQIAPFLPYLKADKAVRLKSDIEELEMVSPNTYTYSDSSLELSINSLAEAFGAAYVMEGSALGGMIIAKHLPHCEQLRGLKKQHFFNGDKSCLTTWNLFKQELARQNFDHKEVQALLEKAEETFLFFENSYRENPICMPQQ
ncbi:MAG TPA: biliverdin-producing heme oxygenase [Salinimicrobium sp.]|nr:biliverdin-producing heme oxygenase [Salinimicrobium sp.]